MQSRQGQTPERLLPKELSASEIRGRLEPILLPHIPSTPVPIRWVDPRSLLTPDRISLGSKLLALRGMLLGTDALTDLYEEHIRLFSLGTFAEPGDPSKNSLRAYWDIFHGLLETMANEGFDATRSVIPLDRHGRLLNGEHRVACAIALGIDSIPCVMTTAQSTEYGQKFFRDRGASDDLLDLSALMIVEHNPSTFAALFWPASGQGFAEAASSLGDVLYTKSISLSVNGAMNLVSEVYRGEPWLGAREEGFPGAEVKAAACFPNSRPLHLVLFKPTDGRDLTLLKSNIRDRLSMGKHSVHINDDHAEAVEIGNLLLNRNGVHFLNHADLRKTGRVVAMLEQFRSACQRAEIPLSSVIIDGSAVLGAYGLREPRDLDYQRVAEGGAQPLGFQPHDETLVFHGCSAETLVADPRRHFFWSGLKFVSLAQVGHMKSRRAEGKDLRDCELIAALEPDAGLRPLLLRLKREARFLVSKYRERVSFLDETLPYRAARRLYRWLFW